MQHRNKIGYKYGIYSAFDELVHLDQSQMQSNRLKLIVKRSDCIDRPVVLVSWNTSRMNAVVLDQFIDVTVTTELKE